MSILACTHFEGLNVAEPTARGGFRQRYGAYNGKEDRPLWAELVDAGLNPHKGRRADVPKALSSLKDWMEAAFRLKESGNTIFVWKKGGSRSDPRSFPLYRRTSVWGLGDSGVQ